MGRCVSAPSCLRWRCGDSFTGHSDSGVGVFPSSEGRVPGGEGGGPLTSTAAPPPPRDGEWRSMARSLWACARVASEQRDKVVPVFWKFPLEESPGLRSLDLPPPRVIHHPCCSDASSLLTPPALLDRCGGSGAEGGIQSSVSLVAFYFSGGGDGRAFVWYGFVATGTRGCSPGASAPGGLPPATADVSIIKIRTGILVTSPVFSRELRAAPGGKASLSPIACPKKIAAGPGTRELSTRVGGWVSRGWNGPRGYGLSRGRRRGSSRQGSSAGQAPPPE